MVVTSVASPPSSGSECRDRAGEGSGFCTGACPRVWAHRPFNGDTERRCSVVLQPRARAVSTRASLLQNLSSCRRGVCSTSPAEKPFSVRSHFSVETHLPLRSVLRSQCGGRCLGKRCWRGSWKKGLSPPGHPAPCYFCRNGQNAPAALKATPLSSRVK